MRYVKGRLLAAGAVLQKTDKYGKSIEQALQNGNDGLYLIKKNGDAYSIHEMSTQPDEPIIIKKVEEVMPKHTSKPSKPIRNPKPIKKPKK